MPSRNAAHFLIRTLALLVITTTGMLCAQEDLIPRLEPRTDWDRFEIRTRTRFGTIKAGRMPEYLDYPNARFSDGLRFGRNNTFQGIDPEVRGSRFREPPTPPASAESVAGQPAPVPTPDASANTLAPTDTASTQAQPRLRRPGFFERPGILEPPSLLSGESLIRGPASPRWFRDLGRRNEAPAPADPNAPAVAVGGVEAMPEPTPTRQAPPDHHTAATRRRRFEQKLEGMLLADPGVHFLSPVRVTFQGGVATVRGVVPSQQHKIAAGNVLLRDPVVKQVDNLISIVPLDPSQTPPPIEPPR